VCVVERERENGVGVCVECVFVYVCMNVYVGVCVYVCTYHMKLFMREADDDRKRCITHTSTKRHTGREGGYVYTHIHTHTHILTM
jgi:hypothetical protein